MAADIRLARLDDVGALVGIENASFSGDRISRASFRRLVGRTSALVLVAVAGSAVVGSAVALLRAGSRVARLYSLAALPAAPAGTGRALLASAERRAGQRNCSAMRLEVRADNHRAVALYRRCGYRETGRIADYYADGHPALRFEKALGPSEASLLPGAGTSAS